MCVSIFDRIYRYFLLYGLDGVDTRIMTYACSTKQYL